MARQWPKKIGRWTLSGTYRFGARYVDLQAEEERVASPAMGGGYVWSDMHQRHLSPVFRTEDKAIAWLKGQARKNPLARRNHHLVKGEKVKWSRKGKGGSHAMTKSSDRGVVTSVSDTGYRVKWTKGALKGSSTFVLDDMLVSARSTSRAWPGNHYEGIDPKARKNPNDIKCYEQGEALTERQVASILGLSLPMLRRRLEERKAYISGGTYSSRWESLVDQYPKARKNPSQGRPMTYEELQAMAKRVANASNIGGFLRFTPAMDREDAISALVVAVLEASGGNFKDVSEQEALQVMKKEKRKLVRQQKSVPPLLPGHLHPIASTLDEEALTHAMGMDYRAGKRQAKRDFERSTGPGSEPMTKAELERHGKKVAYISGYLDQIREEEKEEKEWARKNPSGLPGWKRRLGQMGYAEGLEQAKKDFDLSTDEPDFEVKTKVELEQGPFSPEYIRGYLEQIREEEEEWDRNPPTTEDDLYEPDDWLDNPRRNTMARRNPDKWARMAAERKQRLAVQRGGKKYTRKPPRGGSGWPKEICGMVHTAPGGLDSRSLLEGPDGAGYFYPEGSVLYLTFQKNAGARLLPEQRWSFQYGTHRQGDAQRFGQAGTKKEIIAEAKRICRGGSGGGRRVHLSGASNQQLMSYADDQWDKEGLRRPAIAELHKRGYTQGAGHGAAYSWTKKARNNMGFKLTDSEGRVHEADTFEEYLQMKKDMGGSKAKRSRAASKPRGRGRRAFTPPKNPNAVVSRKQAFSLVKYLKPQVESDTPWKDAIDAMIAHGMTQQQWYDSMQLASNKQKIPVMRRRLEEWVRG